MRRSSWSCRPERRSWMGTSTATAMTATVNLGRGRAPKLAGLAELPHLVRAADEAATDE